MQRIYDSRTLTYFEIEYVQWNQHMALVSIGVAGENAQFIVLIGLLRVFCDF